MFIKIIRHTNDGTSRNHVTVIECDSYTIHPEGPTSFIITCTNKDGKHRNEGYDTEEPGLAIYVMNSHGRTVDTLIDTFRLQVTAENVAELRRSLKEKNTVTPPRPSVKSPR